MGGIIDSGSSADGGGEGSVSRGRDDSLLPHNSTASGLGDEPGKSESVITGSLSSSGNQLGGRANGPALENGSVGSAAGATGVTWEPRCPSMDPGAKRREPLSSLLSGF